MGGSGLRRVGQGRVLPSLWIFFLGAIAGCGTGAGESDVVRLGYFPNLTHAPAVIGVAQGFFQEELGAVEVQPSTFNAGPEAIEALFSEAIDMSFIGPNPAINAYLQSDGEAIRIVAGSTSGGAALVVTPDVHGPGDLVGRRLATPQLGNTQDVALRAWLRAQGLTSDLEGGGDVSVLPQSNAQTLETFQTGEIDGAWVPEPWATRLVVEGGGEVLVDERDLWPGGQFVTTHLIVRTSFVEQHPDLVGAVLRGLVRAVDYTNEFPVEAQQIVNEGIEGITRQRLAADLMAAAWQNLTFTVDPIAVSLRGSAEHAASVGLLEPVDLSGIYALELLNEILVELGREEVSS
ncbi:MAG: ABC transporter substrate-binding protein [Actinomycetota bacterium]